MLKRKIILLTTATLLFYFCVILEVIQLYVFFNFSIFSQIIGKFTVTQTYIANYMCKAK